MITINTTSMVKFKTVLNTNYNQNKVQFHQKIFINIIQMKNLIL